MAYQIDFRAVGDQSKSGDAIAIRYGDLSSRARHTVVVIDGGMTSDGPKLVQFLREEYRTNVVDYVLSTHPDSDHSAGLATVLTELTVGRLIMHRPWEHANAIRDLFANPRVTSSGIEDRLRRSLEDAHELENIAVRRGIPITEPFQGVHTDDGALRVLGPSRDYYQLLIAGFRGTPAPTPRLAALLQQGITRAAEVVRWIQESLNIETLDDSGVTSAENNSSVITLLSLDDDLLLFTGDAGIPALTQANSFAASLNISLASLHLLDVPHHGSKHNVGPTVLNSLRARNACISAAREGAPKHPSRKVTNALRRRGAAVYATCGLPIYFNKDAPRAGWGPATEIPFYDQVED